MTCAACGSENDQASRFCVRCGTPLGTCPACGAPLLGDFEFCPACGAPLMSPAAPVEERKVVTVLFADLVGFTARAEELDPEDVSALLSSYHRRLRSHLEHYGGTVEKFIGDAVVAVFGAPVAHEDDPERAVRAALSIRDDIVALNESEPVDLQMRIAVHTGEAVVVVSARPSEGEGIATGDVLNTASRLQAVAPSNGVLVGERTYRATRGAIEYRPHGSLQVKGKREGVPAWEAVSARRTSESDPSHRDAPLVGRNEELALLHDALLRARRERTVELVTLVGVPGIGKSRLVFELCAGLDEAEETIPRLQGRSPSYGNRGAFSALAEMVKTQAGILPTDGADTAEAKLVSSVETLGVGTKDERWIARHLRSLAGLPIETEFGGGARGEAFAAWRVFFEALADPLGLLLIFEDLHWADDDLLDFVDQLVDRAVDVPLLVIATTRPELLERRPDWGGGKRNAHTVSLSPLSRDETATLIPATADLSAEEHGELLERIGGNPLFAEEYARMLADEEAHDRRSPPPESVQGIIAARIDALRPAEKSLLHDAAVLGQVFWLAALDRMTPRSPAEIEEILYALERKEFVRRERRSSVAGELQYAFKHVLVRDVSYSQIARLQRAEKHRRAADWIESLSADRAEDRAEMLAHHYLSALEYTRAAGQDTGELVARGRKALIDAGDRASSLHAHAASLRFYGAVLDLLPADDPGRPGLLLRYGQARFHAEQTGAEELAEAREGLLANGDRERAAAADVLLFALLTGAGERDRARGHLERAASLLEHADPSRSKAYVLSYMSRFLMGPQTAPDAIRVAREALEMAERLGLADLRTQALSNIGFARVACGDVSGIADLEHGLALALETNSSESVRVYRMLGAAEHFLGDLARGFELYEHGRREALRFGDAFNTRWLEAARAVECYWTGRWDEAVTIANGFIAESAARSRHYLEALCHHVRGEIALARGDIELAVTDAGSALLIGRSAGDSWLLNPGLAFTARVEAVAGRPDVASERADELLATWNGSPSILSYWVADLSVALIQLGRQSDVLELGQQALHTTRWFEAARAHADGDPQRAADVYREIGSRPDEAFARLAAAEWLADAGRIEAAESQREIALGFFREVEADAAIRACDQLLTQP